MAGLTALIDDPTIAIEAGAAGQSARNARRGGHRGGGGVGYAGLVGTRSRRGGQAHRPGQQGACRRRQLS